MFKAEETKKRTKVKENIDKGQVDELKDKDIPSQTKNLPLTTHSYL